MSGDYAPIRKRFMPDELRGLLRQAGVDRTILVQTRSSFEESHEFMTIASESDFVAGVVAWVDLTGPAVADAIAELQARPDQRVLAGIRHQVHDEPDENWLLRDDVQRGLRAVGAAGLVFDLLVRTRELPAALETARRHPDMRFVIDHIAKPPIAAGEIDGWAERMAPFAELEHVACKLSGMVTEADWRRWTPDDFVPYVERVLDWFSEDRLMFGSDWPVCLLAASYQEAKRAAEYALGATSASARERIFGGSAAAVYGLRL